jgi:hypothetical protein
MKSNNYKAKGQIGYLVTIILIIAGAIIIYGFIARFTGKATFEEAINTCRISVVAQSATELKPSASGWKSPLNINCEKRYIKFYNTKVEVGLNPENMKPLQLVVDGQKITRFRSLTEYTVNRVIAEEMRICKFEFADGKTEIFANDENLIKSQTVCFVCSQIHFDTGVKKQTFNTLVEYTKETNLKDYDKTYYEYLTEETISNNSMWSQPMYEVSFWTRLFTSEDGTYANLTIDTSKDYLVFVEKYKPGKLDWLHWGRPMWVAILPADKINNYCNIQAS